MRERNKGLLAVGVLAVVVIALLAGMQLFSTFGNSCPTIQYSIFAYAGGTAAYGANPPVYGPYGISGPYSSGLTGFQVQNCNIYGDTATDSYYNYTSIAFFLGQQGSAQGFYNTQGDALIATQYLATNNATAVSSINSYMEKEINSQTANLTTYQPGGLKNQTTMAIINMLGGAIAYNNALLPSGGSTTTVTTTVATTTVAQSNNGGGGGSTASAPKTTTTIPSGPVTAPSGSSTPQGTSFLQGIIDFFQGIAKFLTGL